MKQKALPSGTAWVLGRGVKKNQKNNFGFIEKHVLMENKPHLSVFLSYIKSVWKLFKVNALVKCIYFMIHACQTSFTKQPNLHF